MSFEAYSATSLKASQTVANFEHVRAGHILPKGGAALGETTGVYDLGSTTYKWDKLYADSFAASVTVSAPVTFTGRATFNTSTTFANGSFPQRISVAYYEAIGVVPANQTGSAFILDFNTVSSNTINGASLTTNQVTLPSGTYVSFVRAPYGMTGDLGSFDAVIHIFDATASLTIAQLSSKSDRGPVLYGTNMAYFSLATASALEVRMEAAGTGVRKVYPPWSGDTLYKNLFGQWTIFKVS